MGIGGGLTGKPVGEAEAHALVGALVEVVEAGMGSVDHSQGRDVFGELTCCAG